MKHEPPVPEANRSPYPLKEAPHDHAAHTPAAAETAAKGQSAGSKKSSGARDNTGSAGSGGKSMFGIGAAVVLGAGAAVAAFLFARRPDAGGPSKSKSTAASKRSGKNAKHSG